MHLTAFSIGVHPVFTLSANLARSQMINCSLFMPSYLPRKTAANCIYQTVMLRLGGDGAVLAATSEGILNVCADRVVWFLFSLSSYGWRCVHGVQPML